MRTREEALSYGLSFPDTYQDAPFHDENWQLVRCKGNKKAFLWTYERENSLRQSLSVLWRVRIIRKSLKPELVRRRLTNSGSPYGE